MKGLILAIVAVGFASVVGVIWVGARTRDATVTAKPYETGLRYDELANVRAALGWRAAVAQGTLRVGASPVTLALSDRSGAPLEGATVNVTVSRPTGSRLDRTYPARAARGGRYVADVAFPEQGLWDLRIAVARAKDATTLEERVRVGE